jgi:transposase
VPLTAPLSLDLRERLIAAVDGGQSCRSATKRIGVAPSTAIKWVALWRRNGHVHPHAPEILVLIKVAPDLTLAEIVAYLESRHGLRVVVSTVYRLLDRHGLTVTRNRARRRAAAPGRAAPPTGLP